MDIIRITPSGQTVKAYGAVDYVSDGVLYMGAEARCVMVTGEEDLEELPDDYAPGSMAYTAGWAAAWQKNAAGEWVSFGLVPDEESNGG